ncbi:hypothetical protein LZD49_09960 [Dyadobacter sp. CY261]|uniref:hypothetical protein n=1 Tax=Dyadobacter sp. CY261 TaxID=2907203 RepID=UPI001F3493E7|nr:hypothetical protein [Dyadobacter sp. CY261]MCF0070796.1 hypothetical protein [Dyadobacter sp. CY261]
MSKQASVDRRAFLKQLGLGAGVLVVFQNCDKDEKGPVKTESKYTLMTNAADPLLMTALSNGGELVKVFGRRDTAGVPLSVDAITLGDVDNGGLSYYYNNKTLNAAIAPNGSRFSFEWLSATRVIVTATTPDGAFQVTTPFSLDSNGKINQAKTKAVNTSRKRGGLRMTFSQSAKAKKADFSANARIAGTGEVNILTTSCGGKADGIISLRVYDSDLKKLDVIPAVRIAEGHYRATIPAESIPEVKKGIMCEYMPELLDIACTVTADGAAALPICEALGLALTLTEIGAVAGIPLMEACPAISGGLVTICETVGFSPTPGAPSASEELCNAILKYRQESRRLLLIAEAQAYPKSKYNPSVQVVPGGPYPDIVFDLGGELALGALLLQPSDPGPYQDYQGTIEISCLPAGSKVVLSIIGTDSYQDSVVYNVTSDEPTGEFSLHVPGAETGVQDMVSLEVILPNGKKVVRSASLIFG